MTIKCALSSVLGKTGDLKPPWVLWAVKYKESFWVLTSRITLKSNEIIFVELIFRAYIKVNLSS